MRSETSQLLSEIKSTELFSNLGRPPALHHRFVSSWDEALESCNSAPWDALQLMTHNRDVNRANELNWHRFQEWNPICEILRPEVLHITEKAIARVASTRKVPDQFRHSVSWDLLHILLEREFEDVMPPFFYVPVLWPIYGSGHFPCAWTGPQLDTDWSASRKPIPDGEVLIY
ncbi:MAG: hypothetical protein JWM68_5858 [Verrucomicrobiales bacterium]|nr:hypothetical protein [Verrucomicrobiales bacterium]